MFSGCKGFLAQGNLLLYCTVTGMSQSFLLETNDFIMKKKILSAHEHYDFEDLQGNKLGEADGNLVQVPPKFEVKDNHGLELMHLQGKVFSLQSEFTFYGSANEALGTIKKKIAKLVGQEFWVEKNGEEFMRIYGNFTSTSIKCR